MLHLLCHVFKGGCSRQASPDILFICGPSSTDQSVNALYIEFCQFGVLKEDERMPKPVVVTYQEGRYRQIWTPAGGSRSKMRESCESRSKCCKSEGVFTHD